MHTEFLATAKNNTIASSIVHCVTLLLCISSSKISPQLACIQSITPLVVLFGFAGPTTSTHTHTHTWYIASHLKYTLSGPLANVNFNCKPADLFYDPGNWIGRMNGQFLMELHRSRQLGATFMSCCVRFQERCSCRETKQVFYALCSICISTSICKSNKMQRCCVLVRKRRAINFFVQKIFFL